MKSTVPVGTGDTVEALIASTCRAADVAVVSNPEFLHDGAAIADSTRPDRIVVDAERERAADLLAELYRPLVSDRSPLLMTSRRTAELIKYSSNAFLATKVTFANERADLCQAVGADVAEVARGMGLDRRIGPPFLQAGPRYGGSFFPKDALALVGTAREHGVSQRVVKSVVAANEARKLAIARRVALACGGSVHGRTIVVLGLAETDPCTS
jgi:UDPglucose 6-dehydrogenase